MLIPYNTRSFLFVDGNIYFYNFRHAVIEKYQIIKESHREICVLHLSSLLLANLIHFVIQ